MQRGGGLSNGGGNVLLRLGARVDGNFANGPASGEQFDLTAGNTIYVLPAPDGHWLQAAPCKAYRKTCFQLYPEGWKQTERNECDANLVAGNCAYNPNPSDPLCTDPVEVQTCPWKEVPELLKTLSAHTHTHARRRARAHTHTHRCRSG